MIKRIEIVNETDCRMDIPANAEMAAQRVLDRTELLITTGIWDGIELQRLRDWFEQFTNHQEKYLAAVLLDALIYRSEKQTTALAIQLFQRRLPAILEAQGIPQEHGNSLLLSLRQDKVDPRIRLVPILRKNDPPSKSGLHICRFLRRELRIDDKWMIWPHQIGHLSKPPVAYIFVDDFLGTGFQASKFFKQIPDHTPSALIYGPLIAYARGVNKLSERCPTVIVTSAETVDDRHRLFVGADGSSQPPYNPETIRRIYHCLLDRLDIAQSLGKFKDGYSKLAMALSFRHATPNATLPLFWCDTNAFRALFAR